MTKRQCLLSRAYSGEPMKIKGTEIVYSALANEIIREFETAFFCDAKHDDQTDHHGLCEAVYVMFLIATDDYATIEQLRAMTRKERHAQVLSFYLANVDDVDAVKPLLMARIESAAASGVESLGVGKSPSQAPEPSP